MKFKIIYSDNPWPYNKRNPGNKFGNGATGTYNIMTEQEMCEMGPKVQSVSEDDSLLFMWATMPRLPMALRVMEAWGFEYVTNGFTWIKINKDGLPWAGPGNYTASNAELVLIGRRGKPLERQVKLVNSVVLAPRTRHSEKPTEVADRIVKMYGDVPRIELFARRNYPGWVCVGNELTGNDIREDLDEIAAKETSSY